MFAQLQAEHAGLLEQFVEFQCALMALDFDLADQRLAQVSLAMGVHAAVEDLVLMPIYAPRSTGIEGGGVELLRAEHGKCERLLAGLREGLLALQAGTGGAREALALIERGFTFKHLWDHHTKREDAVFYPLLKQLVASGAHPDLASEIEAAREAALARSQ